MKKEFKHTPGPWAVDHMGLDISNACDCLQSGIGTDLEWTGVGLLEKEEDGEYVGCHIAYCHPDNALLISKAPALLTALKNLTDSLTADMLAELDHQDEKRNAGHEENCVLCQALAAIAQAEGK